MGNQTSSIKGREQKEGQHTLKDEIERHGSKDLQTLRKHLIEDRKTITFTEQLMEGVIKHSLSTPVKDFSDRVKLDLIQASVTNMTSFSAASASNSDSSRSSPKPDVNEVELAKKYIGKGPKKHFLKAYLSQATEESAENGQVESVQPKADQNESNQPSPITAAPQSNGHPVNLHKDNLPGGKVVGTVGSVRVPAVGDGSLSAMEFMLKQQLLEADNPNSKTHDDLLQHSIRSMLKRESLPEDQDIIRRHLVSRHFSKPSKTLVALLHGHPSRPNTKQNERSDDRFHSHINNMIRHELYSPEDGGEHEVKASPRTSLTVAEHIREAIQSELGITDAPEHTKRMKDLYRQSINTGRTSVGKTTETNDQERRSGSRLQEILLEKTLADRQNKGSQKSASSATCQVFTSNTQGTRTTAGGSIMQGISKTALEREKLQEQQYHGKPAQPVHAAPPRNSESIHYAPTSYDSRRPHHEARAHAPKMGDERYLKQDGHLPPGLVPIHQVSSVGEQWVKGGPPELVPNAVMPAHDKDNKAQQQRAMYENQRHRDTILSEAYQQALQTRPEIPYRMDMTREPTQSQYGFNHHLLQVPSDPRSMRLSPSAATATMAVKQRSPTRPVSRQSHGSSDQSASSPGARRPGSSRAEGSGEIPLDLTLKAPKGLEAPGHMHSPNMDYRSKGYEGDVRPPHPQMYYPPVQEASEAWLQLYRTMMDRSSDLAKDKPDLRDHPSQASLGALGQFYAPVAPYHLAASIVPPRHALIPGFNPDLFRGSFLPRMAAPHSPSAPPPLQPVSGHVTGPPSHAPPHTVQRASDKVPVSSSSTAPERKRSSNHMSTLLRDYPMDDVLNLECRLCHQTYGSVNNFTKHFKRDHPTAGEVVPHCFTVHTISDARMNRTSALLLADRTLTPAQKKQGLDDNRSPLRRDSTPSPHDHERLRCPHCHCSFAVHEKALYHSHLCGHTAGSLHKAIAICVECRSGFSTCREWEIHRIQIHNLQVCNCQLCDKNFQALDPFYHHIQATHGGFKCVEIRFVCHFCGQQFASEVDTFQHAKIHPEYLDRKMVIGAFVCGKSKEFSPIDGVRRVTPDTTCEEEGHSLSSSSDFKMPTLLDILQQTIEREHLRESQENTAGKHLRESQENTAGKKRMPMLEKLPCHPDLSDSWAPDGQGPPACSDSRAVRETVSQPQMPVLTKEEYSQPEALDTRPANPSSRTPGAQVPGSGGIHKLMSHLGHMPMTFSTSSHMHMFIEHLITQEYSSQVSNDASESSVGDGQTSPQSSPTHSDSPKDQGDLEEEEVDGEGVPSPTGSRKRPHSSQDDMEDEAKVPRIMNTSETDITPERRDTAGTKEEILKTRQLDHHHNDDDDEEEGDLVIALDEPEEETNVVD